jgi:DNA-directed RNA polymerase specialized sigma24 family protein
MKSNLVNDRCSESDYQELFASSKGALRWLCYTLTGDEELSEKALDAALEQSLKGAGQVFREWMVSWARRLIIKFCIATARPTAPSMGTHPYYWQLADLGSVNPEQIELALSLPSDVLQWKLLRLGALCRFVFVLRALEGYSRRDTALLLNIDDRACEWAYAQALTAIQPNVYVMSSAGTGLELLSA